MSMSETHIPDELTLEILCGQRPMWSNTAWATCPKCLTNYPHENVHHCPSAVQPPLTWTWKAPSKEDVLRAEVERLKARIEELETR